MTVHPTIKKVLLEHGVSEHRFVDSMLKRLLRIPVEQSSHTSSSRDQESSRMGKETLEILSYKGEFLKPCPGTQNYICCGYQILNVATNCPLDCSYCILQAYMNQPNLRVFGNVEEKLQPVLNAIDLNPQKTFRIGTGEFTDSLALDDITGLSRLLLPEFAKRKNAILELKTKTDRVEHLIASKVRDRIVVSWSLNSSFIATHEEHRAVTLKRRLEAARLCQEEGFVLGFHFDPLVYHDGWQDGYRETVELMDQYIDPKRIIWISLGSFRYMPELKHIIRRRHPESSVLKGEFIKGIDGKMRYFKPLRMEMYHNLAKQLEKWHSSVGTYLCMESDDVWQKSLGWSPGNSDGLGDYLDQRVKALFG